MKDIIIKQEENLVMIKDSDIFFSNAELNSIGCKNCVWKLYGHCVHNLTEEESYLLETQKKTCSPCAMKNKLLICNDMINFILSLGGKDGTVSLIWEQYHLYKAHLEESEDHKKLRKLQQQILERENNLDKTEDDKIELRALRMDKHAAKMWWARLNEHVTKGYQKAADREVKIKSEAKLPGIMSAKTINFNVNKKEIEHDGNDKEKE